MESTVSKKNRGGNGEAAAADQVENQGGAVPVGETPSAGPNLTLTYRREHPGNRCSYGIAGNAGIVVFDKGLFVGGDQPDFQAPATITLDCEMVPVKADNRMQREALKAEKLIERAAKAQARIEAAQERAAERQRKADEALAKAKAKLEAAAATAAPAAE
jgi:hypothetical protein